MASKGGWIMARILICEPYKNLRALYAYELQLEGYEVELAADANEAAQKLESAGADLVVMDTGAKPRRQADKTAAALLRKNGRPVILNTASDAPHGDLPSVPADACLTKSCDTRELKQKISELLGRSRQFQKEEVYA
jgi:DNA-binding response OmpR family regulator